MSQRAAVPDAWDDDWESLADRPDSKDPQPAAAPKLTKSEKRAQHQQLQKELWDSAENPSRKIWLEAQGAVPLKQEPKAPMTVLTRKPMIAKRDAANGVEDDDDSEEEARKKKDAEFEERKRKAAIEREEKVKKYAEVRERIMGSSNPASPAPASRESSQGKDSKRSRGRANGFANSRPSSTGQSPARPMPTTRGEQLFDPEDMGRRLPKRDTTSSPRDGEPTRQPRGPDNSGRGGFGFAGRGG